MKLSIPQILWLGDSISIHYLPFLVPMLAADVRVDIRRVDDATLQNLDRPEGANSGDSCMLLAYLETKYASPASFSHASQPRPGYLCFNCGLHDIKRAKETGQLQVSPERYRHNLTAIVNLIRANGISPIWITTTSVDDAQHNTRNLAFDRHCADLENYAAIAREIMLEHSVPVIDLNAFTASLGGRGLYEDHVHYTPAVRQRQAQWLADEVRRLLRIHPSTT